METWTIDIWLAFKNNNKIHSHTSEHQITMNGLNHLDKRLRLCPASHLIQSFDNLRKTSSWHLVQMMTNVTVWWRKVWTGLNEFNVVNSNEPIAICFWSMMIVWLDDSISCYDLMWTSVPFCNLSIFSDYNSIQSTNSSPNIREEKSMKSIYT